MCVENKNTSIRQRAKVAIVRSPSLRGLHGSTGIVSQLEVLVGWMRHVPRRLAWPNSCLQFALSNFEFHSCYCKESCVTLLPLFLSFPLPSLSSSPSLPPSLSSSLFLSFPPSLPLFIPPSREGADNDLLGITGKIHRQPGRGDCSKTDFEAFCRRQEDQRFL